MPSSAPLNSGAVPADEPRRRRPWLLPLLAVLAVVALLLLLSQCGGDDEDTAVPTTPTAEPAETSTSTSATAPAASLPAATTPPADPSAPAAGAASAEDGTIVSEGVTLLGPEGVSGLSAQQGKAAVGRRVQVQSVPADEGFWAGTSTDARVWVQLQGDTESPYQVEPGDFVDFTGTVTSTDSGFPAEAGVTAEEGAAQLVEQGQHITVDKAELQQNS